MRDIEQFDFPVQTTRHKNIFLWVEVDRADNRLMLMTEVSVHQFLKLKFPWFKYCLIFLENACVRLQELLNRVYQVIVIFIIL
jgi:hypothetical protein